MSTIFCGFIPVFFPEHLTSFLRVVFTHFLLFFNFLAIYFCVCLPSAYSEIISTFFLRFELKLLLQVLQKYLCRPFFFPHFCTFTFPHFGHFFINHFKKLDFNTV